MPIEATETVVYGEAQEGCWFDCTRGRYIGEVVIETAEINGWNSARAGYTDEDLTADGEHYHEAWDAAENYMQQFAAPGYSFGSNESGDWGLWKVEEEV